jgi:nicotinamide phosphoribosyltransferase
LVDVLQGDGINVVTIGKILDAAVAAGFSAENVAFGMGGGLLQRVNRCA